MDATLASVSGSPGYRLLRVRRWRGRHAGFARVQRHAGFARVQRHAGFSLVELMVVIAIIGLFGGLAIGQFKNVGESQALTAAGEKVMGQLEMARQICATRNKKVQFRFYKMTTPANPITKQFVGLGIALLEDSDDPDAEETYALQGRIELLPEGMVIVTDEGGSTYLTSKLIDGLPIQADAVSGPKYTDYKAFIFLPNGSTDIKSTLGADFPVADSYITILPEKLITADASRVKKFIAITIDPATGRSELRQP